VPRVIDDRIDGSARQFVEAIEQIRQFARILFFWIAVIARRQNHRHRWCNHSIDSAAEVGLAAIACKAIPDFDSGVLSTRLEFMTESPKPSTIDHLIKTKSIGKMTADEYLAAVRQAQLALHDGKRELERLTRRRYVA